MSTLHTVNKSPFATSTLLSCLKHCRSGDAILLIEDGVYGAIAGSAIADEVEACTQEVTLFVLAGDLQARGIDTGKIASNVKAVGYDGFVDLVTNHDRTQSWL
jgi:tRNA 2-thiouridine synthesizing protein B